MHLAIKLCTQVVTLCSHGIFKKLSAVKLNVPITQQSPAITVGNPHRIRGIPTKDSHVLLVRKTSAVKCHGSDQSVKIAICVDLTPS